MNNNILIVDADQKLTTLLTQYLKAEGFNTDIVHEGEQAIKKALNFSYDAIILDIMVPKRNGFEILEAIREHLQTPVLMLTAREDEVDMMVALELGADDYLTKPCNPSELIARLRTILRRTQKFPHIDL